MSGEWSRERIDLIKKSICPKGISDDEFALFIEQCKRSGLDPLLNQAFCVPRDSKGDTLKNPDGSTKMEQGSNGKWYPARERLTRHVFQPSEAGMLARAEHFPDYRGVMGAAVFGGDEVRIDEGEGKVEHRYNPAKREGALVGAWSRVRREGKDPVVRWLDFAARSQTTPLWIKDPAGMILKCVRVAALRTAYPEAFGGLYVAGERPDDVDTGEEEQSAPELSKPALPAPGPRETLEAPPARERVPVRREEPVDAVCDPASREPGADDDAPEPSDEEVCQGVEERCREATTLAALRSLAPIIKRWPVGNEHRSRAGKAYQEAQARLTRGPA
jgi:phage recombination protein Bet